jgi:O-antigen ligase
MAWLQAQGLPQVDRLRDVLEALRGSPQRLLHNDVEGSRILSLVQTWEMFQERPLLGYGTGHFVTPMGMRPHVEFMVILGENGLVGLVLYCAVWVLVVISTVETRGEVRRMAQLIILVLFMAQFQSPTMLEFRAMGIPMAWALLGPFSRGPRRDSTRKERSAGWAGPRALGPRPARRAG